MAEARGAGDVKTFGNFWREVTFTSALRVRMAEDEVELLRASEVSLRAGDANRGYERGDVIVTTHRIIWMPAEGGDEGVAVGGDLCDVERADVAMGRWKKSSKVSVWLRNQADGGAAAQVKLKFHARGRDSFLERLQDALERRSWSAAAAPGAKQEGFSTRRAGVQGILRRQAQRENAEKVLASTAFEDLDSLIEKAREVVAVIERLGQQQKQQHEGLLEGLGVSSVPNAAAAVTRSTAGGRFHEQLAREMCDLLLPVVDSLGGMLTLQDAYCVVNRARGTELCSPEDVLCAAALMAPTGLPLRLQEFATGVKVLRRADHRDDLLAARLADMAEERHAREAALMPVDVAREMRCGVTLARQYLEMAEAAEAVVRDEGPEGLRFFPNLFPAFLATAGA